MLKEHLIYIAYKSDVGLYSISEFQGLNYRVSVMMLDLNQIGFMM